MKLIQWIKTHKLVTFLVLALLYLFLKNLFLGMSMSTLSLPAIESTRPYDPSPSNLSQQYGEGSFSMRDQQSKFDTEGRVVIQESNLSLQVDNVRQAGDAVIAHARSTGGYMVSASYNSPEESPFASVTVRVPANSLDGALLYFRSLAVKVVNENLVGTDVTKEYTDIEARLTTLRQTKAKFEEIQDILNVQREIISLQAQIDALIGEQRALRENADLTRITIYLSTDELALPYTPDDSFRPTLIFKQAVRSLLGSFYTLGKLFIWLGVYSLIWVPILVGYLYYRSKKRRKPPTIS